MNVAAVRKLARRRGYHVCKSRDRSTHLDNFGKFQLIDDCNMVVMGEKFDCTIEEIAEHLRAVEPSFKLPR